MHLLRLILDEVKKKKKNPYHAFQIKSRHLIKKWTDFTCYSLVT